MFDDQDFTLYLPSDVTGNENNTIANYKTLLSSPISLDPNEEYEIGMVSCIYPANAFNVYDASFAFYSFTFGYQRGLTLPKGSYPTIKAVTDAITQLLSADHGWYRFWVNETTQTVSIDMGSNGAGTPYMKFGTNLMMLLGQPAVVSGKGTHNGTPYDLTVGVGTMYIHCDVCGYSNVGNATAPVLAAVPYGKSVVNNIGEHMAWEPKHILYKLLKVSTL